MQKWRAPSPFCIQPAPIPSPQESNWSDKDWNGNRQREREVRRKKEQQQKEKEEKNKKEQVPKDYFPPIPIYDPTNKEDTLPHCDPEMKQALDPNYYPLNYVPKQEEDASTLVHNLVSPLARTTKKKKTREKTKGRRTMKEIQRR